LISTELFPYENHPYRLEFGEKKNSTVCFFSCEEHLQKYLERYKLDKRTIKLDYRDGEPVESGKKQQNSVQKRPRKISDRSSGTGKKRTTLVDSSGNTPSNSKRKK
jgi:hypothetical protein